MVYFEQIDAYLNKELTEEERLAFEAELLANPDLGRALAEEEATRAAIGMLQIDAAVQRYEKVAVQYKAAKRRERNRWMRGLLAGVVVLGIGAWILNTDSSVLWSSKQMNYPEISQFYLDKFCQEDAAQRESGPRTSAGSTNVLPEFQEEIKELCELLEDNKEIPTLIVQLEHKIEKNKSLELNLASYLGLLYLHEENLPKAQYYFEQAVGQKGLYWQEAEKLLESMER